MTDTVTKSGGLRLKGHSKSSLPDKPLMSVVTVVYNGEKHLEQTIKSVLEQTYENIEYIIIDGGSTDSTLDIIRKYEDRIDYWISEPDNGIYSAMNKGTGLASGEYISFINADDWYNQTTLSSVVTAIIDNKSDYIFGNLDIYENDVIISTYKEKLQQYKFNMPFGHPTLFVKTKYLLIEPFDLTYKVIADYNFVIGLIKKQLSYSYIDQSLVNFRIGGISTSVNLEKEKFRLYYSHFGIIRAVYSYMLITNHLLIKPINALIQGFRLLRKKFI